MQRLFLLSKQNTALSAAELLTFTNKEFQITDNLVITELTD